MTEGPFQSFNVLNLVVQTESVNQLMGVQYSFFEGKILAGRINRPDLQAYFMAKTAGLSILQVGIWHHKKTSLKLAPRWFNFATEADRKEYESLTTLIDSLESETDALLSQALSLSEASGDKKLQASVLMSEGEINGARYLQNKMNCFSGIRAKIWSNFKLTRRPFFEYLLTCTNSNAKKLRYYIRSFTHSFLKAADLGNAIDDVIAGYAYYNFAIQLRSAYRFRSAKNYLKKGRKIANKHNDTSLIMLIDDLEKVLAKKNNDIPDYLAGETRELNS